MDVDKDKYKDEYKDRLVITGAWVQAGGNIISAIGSTRAYIGEENVEDGLIIVGESLQAIGNLLPTFVQNDKPLAKAGNQIQALGNTSDVVGTALVVMEKDTEKGTEKENDLLLIAGNSLQSLGALVSALDEIKDVGSIQKLEIIGNLLQTIGAGLQAIQAILNYKMTEDEEEIQLIGVIGGWVQATGTVIAAIGETEEAIVED